ncbi:probable mediator of RNA polymerase II transcription subunit 26c [Cynara cardunculus var. scolymus]|nr:probable mediator of RNA polymerase II transcription subunit 26c [Cynara cardunculus var. scolymus]
MDATYSCHLINSMKQDDASIYTSLGEPEIKQETKIVAEVLKIKQILDKTPYESQSVAAVVYESLSKLQHLGLSFKTLEATGIGKSVGALQKHASRDVRQIAKKLVRIWKGVVDEWFNATENMSTSKGGEEWNMINPAPIKKQTSTVRKKKHSANKFQLSEREEESKEIMRMEEKLEATKRKLLQGYQEAENKKRQRRIQVIDLHELTQEHLLPQTQHRVTKYRNLP